MFWLWLAFEKPSKHPCISTRELRYIEDSLGQGQVQMPIPTFSTTPWRKFLTSMPVYAIIVANFCRSWNFYLLVLFQARFMHEAFDMPLVEVSSYRSFNCDFHCKHVQFHRHDTMDDLIIMVISKLPFASNFDKN